MKDFQNKCLDIRKEILDIFIKGGRGHLPSAFSLVEILVTLYYKKFNLTPDSFTSLDRDRVILSKGHGCLALYAILSDLGFISKDEYHKFCKVGGILGGHPARLKVPGVEVSTGSLGHGLSVGIGMALSLKKNQSKKMVTVVLGDGECNEGTIWEAALSAAKNRLDNLIVLIDHNKFQSYGPVDEVCSLAPFGDKWKSFGFTVHEVDMVNEADSLIDHLKTTEGKPTAIICHTIKGQGHKLLEGNLAWHHKSKLNQSDIDELLGGLK
ncbi:transketolase [Halobacteriovorax marinus]|uniref:Transketolase n=1 Tax=Halobacteriovorax marinus TaxID=97084 RepID=A0A1Y5F323_9BACT|nr:transketolase [Halobacteriovorax marinus]